MAFKSGDGDKKAHATNEAQLIFSHAGMKSVCFGNDDDYFLCGISKNNLREVAKKFKRDSSTFYIIPGWHPLLWMFLWLVGTNHFEYYLIPQAMLGG